MGTARGQAGRLALAVTLPLLAGLLACSGAAPPAIGTAMPVTPEQGTPEAGMRIPGLLSSQAGEGDVEIDAPATVRAGEGFFVTITTFGGGCESAGDESVILAEASATVLVYDFTVATSPGVACTAIRKGLIHTVALRFVEPGEAVIRVWGRRVAAGTPPLGEPVVIERRILVQPGQATPGTPDNPAPAPTPTGTPGR
jgi:hypothetical protein